MILSKCLFSWLSLQRHKVIKTVEWSALKHMSVLLIFHAGCFLLNCRILPWMKANEHVDLQATFTSQLCTYSGEDDLYNLVKDQYYILPSKHESKVCVS